MSAGKACDLTDLPKKPSPSSQGKNRATEINERIHSDLSGPFRESAAGNIYYITFTDEHTRETDTYTIKRKSEAYPMWKEYKAKMELQKGHPIKEIQFDGGREYNNNEFINSLKANGITYRVTIPYEHEQMGLAERVNRTLKKIARALLKQSKIGPEYWDEAIKHVTYLKKLTPTSALEGKTPFEKRFGRKPDVSHIRSFGCTIYAKIPDEKIRKSEPTMDQAIKCKLLGYEEGRKGFRLLNLLTNKVIYARSVTFRELPLVIKDQNDFTYAADEPAVPDAAEKR